MYSRIMVPLDGSPLAGQALPLAKMLAARCRAKVVLFQALAPVSDARHAEALRSQAHVYLEGVRKDFAAAGIEAETELRVGAPATAILEFAESTGVDLMVMATHGRSGALRWIYGSVADKVLHSTRVPVLLIRVSEQPRPVEPITRIVVPLDGSALAEKALDPARQLAAAFDAEVVLLVVWQIPAIGFENVPISVLDEWEEAARADAERYVADVKNRLQAQGIRVQAKTQCGGAAESILETAESANAHLIVMSSHGRSGISRWVLGSVADRVLRSSAIPVLLIRLTQSAA